MSDATTPTPCPFGWDGHNAPDDVPGDDLWDFTQSPVDKLGHLIPFLADHHRALDRAGHTSLAEDIAWILDELRTIHAELPTQPWATGPERLAIAIAGA